MKNHLLDHHVIYTYNIRCINFINNHTLSLDTDEENFRAYKLFSMIDIDNRGSISLRKLNRVILGSAERLFLCSFPHPDTGIVWTIDEDKCACIGEIEPHSIASKSPILTLNLRVRKVQEVLIPSKDSTSLSQVHRELVRLGENELTMEFLEPAMVVNSFNCMLGKTLSSILMYLGH